MPHIEELAGVTGSTVRFEGFHRIQLSSFNTAITFAHILLLSSYAVILEGMTGDLEYEEYVC